MTITSGTGQRLGTISYDRSDFEDEFDDLRLARGLYRVDRRLSMFIQHIFGSVPIPTSIQIQ